MLGLRFVLLLAVGLSLGVVYPSADSWAQTTNQAATATKQAATPKKKASLRGKRCVYNCPKGTYICSNPPPDEDGCFPYTCTTGRPGSESCP
jgi:hypothetical protein